MSSVPKSSDMTACLSLLDKQCEIVHLIADRLSAPIDRGDFNPRESCSELIKAKPFACTEYNCNKKYGRRDHLDRHKLVHKPPSEVCFECQRNGERKYAFTNADKLSRHIIEVHTGRPYALVSEEGITWKGRVHHTKKTQTSAEPGLEKHYNHICQLALSFPRKNRRTGGRFSSGPLHVGNGNEIQGSSAFNKRGQLQRDREDYHIIRKMLSKHKSRSHAPAPVQRLRRSNRKPKLGIRLAPQFFSKKSGPAKPVITDDGFTELCTNLYGVPFFNFEKPRGRPKCWPKDWTWPESPTYIPEDEHQCDHCDKKTCQCIIQEMKAGNCLSVRACETKGKGMGVFATVKKTNCGFRTRVYEAHTVLMPLTGTLVPDHQDYNDGWSAQIRRDDLPGAPVLGRIYCRYTGNLVRYVNHSCDNNSILHWCRCSGKYTLELRTLRDIYDGEEITANYGPDYFTKENPCLCGSEKCVSRIPESRM